MLSGRTSPSGPSGTFSGTVIHGLSIFDPRARSRRSKTCPQCVQKHAAHGAVQLDDAPAAGAHVQTVDVLRDDAGGDAAASELGEGQVARVRRRCGERPPPEMAADPVAAPGVFARRGTGLTVMGVRTGAPSPR